MTDIRTEADSLGEVDVAADRLWGAQTQRSLEHFSIGKDLIQNKGGVLGKGVHRREIREG